MFKQLNGNFIVTLIDNGRRKIIESQENLSFFKIGQLSATCKNENGKQIVVNHLTQNKIVHFIPHIQILFIFLLMHSKKSNLIRTFKLEVKSQMTKYKNNKISRLD